MGTVPPRIIPPIDNREILLRKLDEPTHDEQRDTLYPFYAPASVSLDEVRVKMDLPPMEEATCYFNDAHNVPVFLNMSVVRERWFDDGRGGLLSVDDLRPIYQIGRTEPIAYMDKVGRMYPVEQERQGQYEDALVEYGEC